jgi:heme oxygenase
MLEKSIKELNLDDRMYLAIHDFKGIIIGFTVLLACASLLILYAIISPDLPVQGGSPAESEFLEKVVLISTALLMATFGTLLIIESSKFFKKLSRMQQQKIRQRYFLTLETAIPEGETTVERVYDILENVLPEIKLAKKNARKKGEKFQYDLKFKNGGEVFDLKVDTSEGIILVEFFDKTLSWDDLEDFMVRTSKVGFRIFRIVCVSKDLDDIFSSEELSDKIKKLDMSYKIDLLKEDKTGFTTYFIG